MDEKRKERLHLITELDAEISDLKDSPPEEGKRKKHFIMKSAYYERLSSLYEEKDNIIKREIEERERQRAEVKADIHRAERKIKSKEEGLRQIIQGVAEETQKAVKSALDRFFVNGR